MVAWSTGMKQTDPAFSGFIFGRHAAVADVRKNNHRAYAEWRYDRDSAIALADSPVEDHDGRLAEKLEIRDGARHWIHCRVVRPGAVVWEVENLSPHVLSDPALAVVATVEYNVLGGSCAAQEDRHVYSYVTLAENVDVRPNLLDTREAIEVEHTCEDPDCCPVCQGDADKRRKAEKRAAARKARNAMRRTMAPAGIPVRAGAFGF